MSLLNKFFNNVRARTVDLRQSADDGTDRVIVRGSDGNAKAEVFFDGTNTVVNPLTGNVDIQGAADIDSVTADEASIKEGSAMIVNTADQAFANLSATTVEFNSEDGDHTPGDVLTVDLANNRITIEKAGRYWVKFVIAFDSPGDGTRLEATLREGGSAMNGGRVDVTPGANDVTSIVPGTLIELASGDVPANITADVYQESGGSIDSFGGSNYVALSVGRIG